MRLIPRGINNLLQLQLIQEDFATLHIRVLPCPGFSGADAKAIEERARAKIPSSMAVRLQVVDRLETTPRGKAPLVIRRVDG